MWKDEVSLIVQMYKQRQEKDEVTYDKLCHYKLGTKCNLLLYKCVIDTLINISEVTKY